jgi:VWFA-related protein
MPRSVGVAGGLFALCLAAVPAAQDQNPSQEQEPFRGGVTLVNVDVYPRRDGRVVEGLSAEDFQILEDGVPQAIEAFEFIRIEPNTPDAERRDPNTKEEGDRLAADPRSRVFVVYLDIYHTTFEGAQASRVPLLDFLTRTIGSADLFGVMTPEVPPRQLVFGRRIETLEEDLTNYFDTGLRSDRTMSPIGRPEIEADLHSCMRADATLLGETLVALHREDLMLSNLEELTVRLSALRDGRKSLLFVSEGWVPQPPSPVLSNLVNATLPQPGQGPGGSMIPDSILRRSSGQTQSWCDRQIVRLATIDFDRRFRDLLTLANQANVSFYTVDAGRLRTEVSLRPRRTRALAPNGIEMADIVLGELLGKLEQPSVSTLRTLAENTDGMAIVNTNDLGAAFRRIADDLSAYYLLGYASTNQEADGRFRRIEVKLHRPNVELTARRGYLAPSSEARAAAAAADAASAVPALEATELGRLSRLRPDAELFSYAVVREGRLAIAVEIAGGVLARSGWRDGAEVAAAVTGAGGERTATARVDAGARGALVEIPLSPGESGPWSVSLRVSGSDAVLTDRFQADVPATSTSVGVPLVFRGTASSRIPLRPVADFQFRRNERVRVVWPVAAPPESRSARLLDRRGEPLAVPATITETPGEINVDVLLAPLAEGDYLVELTTGQGGQSERYLLAFRVVR